MLKNPIVVCAMLGGFLAAAVGAIYGLISFDSEPAPILNRGWIALLSAGFFGVLGFFGVGAIASLVIPAPKDKPQDSN